MTWRRFLGIRHQADQWPSPHERARFRSAERLDWPLDAAEEAWLTDHLATCAACASVAAQYEAHRSELRLLRAHQAPPPRDLWARTAAAIETQAGDRRTLGQPGHQRRQPIRLPLGAISGALVVAVVVGASLLSQGTPVPTPSASHLTASTVEPVTPSPIRTPFQVLAAADVGWVELDPSGESDVLLAPIDEVCPDERTTGCAPIDGAPQRTLKLAQAPVAVVRSPAEGELIVVDHPEGATGDTVYALPAPTPTTRPSPTPSGSVAPTETAVPTVTQEPTPTVQPTASASATDEPPSTPSPSASAPDGSDTPPSEAPSSDVPTASPVLPVEGAIAIATGIVLVGDNAAYSPDGRWFAFSARPADGSSGPDVYVWQSGRDAAVALTTDHQTVFASWLDDKILASRAIALALPTASTEPVEPSADPSLGASPEPSAGAESSETPSSGGTPDDPGASGTPEPAVYASQIVVIDPASGTQTAIGIGAWRPSVRHQRDAAVYWDGTLEPAEDGVSLRPSTGRLVLSEWPVGGAARDPQILEAQAVVDWDARWDATGTRLAVWVADERDPDLGTLSLYLVDSRTGALDRGRRPLVDVVAIRGFSLADGRLAWVTPSGQDGQGSRVQVLAWTEDGFGKVETLPGKATIVVIR